MQNTRKGSAEHRRECTAARILKHFTTRNQALDNTYIWLQYGYFGCNWNQLHLSLVVDRWLQLERCNSLRQPHLCGVATDFAIAMNKKA